MCKPVLCALLGPTVLQQLAAGLYVHKGTTVSQEYKFQSHVQLGHMVPLLVSAVQKIALRALEDIFVMGLEEVSPQVGVIQATFAVLQHIHLPHKDLQLGACVLLVVFARMDPAEQRLALLAHITTTLVHQTLRAVSLVTLGNIALEVHIHIRLAIAVLATIVEQDGVHHRIDCLVQ